MLALRSLTVMPFPIHTLDRGRAQAADIKKRVESLIERDYLERDDGDANVLRYLA